MQGDNSTSSSQHRRVVWLYYAFQSFFALLFWVPIFYEYQKQIGLSDTEIFRIQSIYYIVFCLLEIPTGYLADRWGRLESMRAGAWTLVISNALPFVSPNYYGMLIHFLLLALARSFISGASSAYIYGYLANLGDTETFKVIEGRARAYGLVAKVISWGAVGYMMTLHLSLPYWASTITAVFSVIFAHMLPHSDTSRTTPKTNEGVGPAFRELRSQPMLTLIIVQGVSLFVLGRVVQVNLFQPILSEKLVPVPTHGVIMAAMALFEAIGSAYPQVIRKYLTDLNAVFVLTILTALTLTLMASFGSIAAILGLLIFALVSGLSFPIQRQLFNDTIIDTRYRATLMSIESIVDRAFSALIALFLADYVATGRTGFLLNNSAIFTIVLMIVLYGATRLSKRIQLRK